MDVLNVTFIFSSFNKKIKYNYKIQHGRVRGGNKER